MARWLVLLGLFGMVAHAQEEEQPGGGEGAGDDGETEIIVSGGGAGDRFEIVVDPFFTEPPQAFEPNRPRAVKVGDWPAPPLDGAAQRTLEILRAAVRAEPEGRAPRYHLAEFYLKQRWYPHAEQEFKRAAQLDPASIRAWEGLLRVYRAGDFGANAAASGWIINIGPNNVITRRRMGNADWLSSTLERDQLLTGVYLEILKRRPDELARRREFVAHLKKTHDFERLAVQARIALRQLAGDASMRYDLAEALRHLGHAKKPDEQGLHTTEWVQAAAQLEENLRRNPDHVPTLLRLARMLYHEHGNKVADRVTRLEQRAFFRLFVMERIAPVPFRTDTLRMATRLAGARIASRLWDAAMRPGGPQSLDPWNPNARIVDRWIFLTLSNIQADSRTQAIQNLARRGDEAVAGLVLALLWHLPGLETFPAEGSNEFKQTARIEALALATAGKLGPVCYRGAERFLRQADTDGRRRRGVTVLAALGDRRAVTPLLEALAHDQAPERSLGVAAALERIGDPRAIDGLIQAASDLRRPAARRREAIEALAAFEGPRAFEAIKRLAKQAEFGLVTAYGLFRLAGSDDAFERMREAITPGGSCAEVLRLASKCDSARIEGLLLEALERCPAEIQPAAVAMLRQRFWGTARAKVQAILLRQAHGVGLNAFRLQTLGGLGGEEVATHLLSLLPQLKGERWDLVARAFAQTGDARAVPYFNRMRILDRDAHRRKLAAELHPLAAQRHAQLLASAQR